MPEIGRDDRDYWVKRLMGLGVEAHRLGEKLRQEQELFDPDGAVRCAKMAVYAFECDCNARNAELIATTAMSDRQRRVMKWRYIKKKPWADIFRYLNTTLRYAYKIHARALRRVGEQHDDNFKALYHAEQQRLAALDPYLKEQ